MIRLRLLKVLIQPVYLVDDGETLTEQPQHAVELTVSQWATIVADLEAERVAVEADMNSTDTATTDDPEDV